MTPSPEQKFTDDLQYKDPAGINLAKRGFKRMNDPRLVFSDEDLKRLKDEFEPYVLGDPRILTGSDWEGIVARLEAAENYIEYPAIGFPGYEASIHEELFRKWRQASGK